MPQDIIGNLLAALIGQSDPEKYKNPNVINDPNAPLYVQPSFGTKLMHPEVVNYINNANANWANEPLIAKRNHATQLGIDTSDLSNVRRPLVSGTSLGDPSITDEQAAIILNKAPAFDTAQRIAARSKFGIQTGEAENTAATLAADTRRVNEGLRTGLPETLSKRQLSDADYNILSNAEHSKIVAPSVAFGLQQLDASTKKLPYETDAEIQQAVALKNRADRENVNKSYLDAESQTSAVSNVDKAEIEKQLTEDALQHLDVTKETRNANRLDELYKAKHPALGNALYRKGNTWARDPSVPTPMEAATATMSKAGTQPLTLQNGLIPVPHTGTNDLQRTNSTTPAAIKKPISFIAPDPSTNAPGKDLNSLSDKEIEALLIERRRNKALEVLKSIGNYLKGPDMSKVPKTAIYSK